MAIGYDNRALNSQLLLDLQFREGLNTITRDWAKPEHADPTLTGPPAWTSIAGGKNVLSLNPAIPDFIEIAALASADLDFIADDCSFAVWVYVNSLASDRWLINRGLNTTDGYYCYIDTNGAIHFLTAQAAAEQDTYTANGAIVVNTWYLIVITRSGAAVKIYVNGTDVTSVAAAHIDPITAARKFLVGVEDDEATNPYSGYIGEVWVWSRTLATKEPKQLFELTRDEYGV